MIFRLIFLECNQNLMKSFKQSNDSPITKLKVMIVVLAIDVIFNTFIEMGIGQDLTTFSLPSAMVIFA